MTLQAGDQLGPYEIAGPLGAGGMGEVYRARDTRLDRTVAVKVLPAHLSGSPELRARFEREARAASSLNHPHICAVYDVGSQEGVDYLVMEYLEGETLATRLQRGALPLEELLTLAAQVVDALDRAHRQGLVHRDLKPGNIMLTRSGAKLMDFGLAKSMGPLAAGSLTAAPTATSPLTAQGAILGTIQYMSPEQLEGKEADPRSDLFALGAVLHEMAAGQPAFRGATQASVIAAILKEEPVALGSLAPATPPALDRLIRACLRKDPEERLQSAHDVKVQIDWLREGVDAAPPARTAGQRDVPAGWRMRLAASAALLAAGAVGWTVAWVSARSLVPPPREIRFEITAGREETILGGTETSWSASPDGSRIAYTVRGADGTSRILLRRLDGFEALPVGGTEGGERPFWSPEGERLGFVAGREIRIVPVAGGSPRPLCELPGALVGATWGKEGTILFSTVGQGVQRVSEAGGSVETVTEPDRTAGEIGHHWPVFLPDGRRFLYLSHRRDADARVVMLGFLDGGASRPLLPSRYAAGYADPGHVLFVRGATLMAQAVDWDGPSLLGEAVPVADPVATASVPGYAAFDVSRSGVILVRATRNDRFRTRLAWLDRSGGRREVPGGEEAADISLALSPDGARAAVDRVGGAGADSAGANPPTNLWITDLRRGVGTRVTVDPRNSDESPVWSPDGERLAYASHLRGNDAILLIRRATGAGEVEEQPVDLRNPHPTDWSPDGTTLMLHGTGGGGDLDLVTVAPGGNGATAMVAGGPGDQAQGQFSPDALWVSYTSSESGQNEVYVRSHPGGEVLVQISARGGSDPRWRADGREIFYIAPDGTLMAVDVETTPALRPGAPQALFRLPTFAGELFFYGGAQAYAPSRDGQRFLFHEVLSRPTAGPLRVIAGWSPAGR